MARLEVPQGQFELTRYPEKSHPSLRAWDAADELLLFHIDEIKAQLPSQPQLCIFNENFGALATALNPWQPISISDSFLCHQGTQNNYLLNKLECHPSLCLSSTSSLSATADLVLIKIPKTLALLEHQLHQLKPHITPDTRIIAAGMVKHIHRSTLELFTRIIGPTHTSLAKKKARLIFSEPDSSIQSTGSPYPSYYQLDETQHQICNQANVFCREKLDIGTRLFLQHLPTNTEAQDIIDLGCGNGIVGLIAAERNPQATVHFVDESYMAVASAETNFKQAFGIGRVAKFEVGNCLDSYPPASADLILNNPPFHQQQVVGDHIAWLMFQQSYDCLRQGGELWVVGNRHLGYHNKLKKLFGNCKTMASNAKFVILKADKE
ncbi:MAG: methyltransferase [Motiliproteus sp.]